MTQIQLIEDADALHQLGPEWNELAGNSNSAGLFMTHEWLSTWWKHLGEGHRLQVAAVRSGGRLVAVAPFILRPARIDRHPAFACIELLGAGEVGSDYLDVIVRRGFEEETLSALGEVLAEETHVLVFRRLRRGSFVEALANAMSRRGWTAMDRDDEVAPFIPLAGRSFDDYLSSLGATHRSEFRRRVRSLQRRHRLDVERVEAESRRREGMASLIGLHLARWGDRSEAFSRPELIAFHQEISRLALARGWLRLFVLRLDGEPAAAFHGFRYGDVFHFYQTGFDPRFARLSVGLALFGLVIRSALEEGATEFDLLHGDEPYKRHWARDARPLRRLELYPPGLRGLLYLGASTMERQARKVVRSVAGANPK